MQVKTNRGVVLNILLTVDNYFTRQPISVPTLYSYDIEREMLSVLCHHEPALDRKKLIDCKRDTFRPFGIALLDDNSVLVASHDAVGVFCLDTGAFDGVVPEIKTFPNTHQLAVSKGKIYSANTANDSLGIFDVATKQMRFFDFKSFCVTDAVVQTKDAESNDGQHINSVNIVDGKIYVVAHRLGKKMSSIYCFDETSFSLIWQKNAGYCAHNTVIVGNNLYTLSTQTGDLVVVDLMTFEKNTVRIVNPANGFLRGLRAYGTDLFFVSSMNFQNPSSPKECWLFCFDTTTKNVTKKFNLDPVLVVNDIAVVA